MPKNPEKSLYGALALDFYGEFLPEKQREILRLYYECDLSLNEIAGEYGMTRQGAYDYVLKAEKLFTEMEEKLGLIKNAAALKAGVRSVREKVNGGAVKEEILAELNALEGLI